MTNQNNVTAGRIFAYCRVSTIEQTTENQIQAIAKAGYCIEPHRIVTENISGSVITKKRPEFSNLINNKLEPFDTLVVLKLDRLGRDAIDIQQTIAQLSQRNIRLISLDLPSHDLTSPEGKLILGMFSAFAEFERNRIRERTREGLERVKKQGVKLGRPEAIDTYQDVQNCKLDQLSQSKTAEKLGKSLSTVKRHWKAKG